MNTVEKTEDELYNEWLAKNEKFLDRYNREHAGKHMLESSGLYKFFSELSHDQWVLLNRGHIYVELQDLLKNMIPYYFNQTK